MGLATAIKEAGPEELDKLGAYLAGEFEVTARNPMTDEPAAAEPREIAAALAAWAYMQLNAQDVGD